MILYIILYNMIYIILYRRTNNMSNPIDNQKAWSDLSCAGLRWVALISAGFR